MDGRVFQADSPVWDTWYPPNGFRCRCTVRSLSKRQVEQMGLTVEEKAPDRAGLGVGAEDVVRLERGDAFIPFLLQETVHPSMDDIESIITRNADFTFEDAVRYFGERVPVTAAQFYKIAIARWEGRVWLSLTASYCQ